MKTTRVFVSVLVLLFLAVFVSAQADDDYQIGTSIGDVTGPAAEAGMMGYAMVNQRTHGLHIRQRVRVYAIRHKLSGTSFVYVHLDLCMTMQAVKLQVAKDLATFYPEVAKFYDISNIMLTATHTHAGPGGFSWYTLYDITTFGFDSHYYHSMVKSIVEAIVQAHKNLSAGGSIYVNSGLLFDSNINRSPSSYLNNPIEERDKYKEQGDTDKIMTVLRLEDEKGRELGVISWFAVHCTSMTNTNLLISGDNKGYASYIFEKYKNGNDSLPGVGPFIAAFSQANEGDVSPNTRGPTCPDGTPCDLLHSTCKGRTEGCIAKGPGNDEFESTKIIGTRQFSKALELYDSAKVKISGPLAFRHTFVDMTNVTVLANYTTTAKQEKTCRAALGYSFAAGTTDGPGEFDFIQGMNNTGNPFWNFVIRFLKYPTEEQKKCQHPKPIILDVGEMNPLPWVATSLPLQVFTIGKGIIIIAVPGEFSTMAGRRLKERVKTTLIKYGKATEDTHVVIAGLANAYSQYITTFEEYQAQRYEAASTLYGPHTHAAYMQEYDKLAAAIGADIPVPAGPVPQNLTSHVKSFQPGVIFDSVPAGKHFGDVHKDVKASYKSGETVSVEFWSGHPKNDYMTGKTFLTVERQEGSDWKVILTDGDWDTKFHWARLWVSESIANIEWTIAAGTPPGTYRIRHFGVHKTLLGKLEPYTGTSSTFTVA